MSEPSAYPQQQTTPVCPRHPDRVSYVRCQRCARPVCPECQRPAAVGVQCIDCVREQAATVRSATTVFGGRVTDTPVVSYAIIAICVLVYVLQVASPGLTNKISFVPVLGESEPWRFLTSAFAHGERHAHPVQHARAVDGGGAVPRTPARRRPVRRGLPRQRDRRLGRLPAHVLAAVQRLRPLQHVADAGGRGLGCGVRPVRGAARPQPAPRAGPRPGCTPPSPSTR